MGVEFISYYNSVTLVTAVAAKYYNAPPEA